MWVEIFPKSKSPKNWRKVQKKSKKVKKSQKNTSKTHMSIWNVRFCSTKPRFVSERWQICFCTCNCMPHVQAHVPHCIPFICTICFIIYLLKAEWSRPTDFKSLICIFFSKYILTAQGSRPGDSKRICQTNRFTEELLIYSWLYIY